MSLLEIRDLSVSYRRKAEPALHGINLDLAQGERLAVLGESGSGKSTLALAIAGLLPPGATVSGKIQWQGLNGAPVLGRDIGFVFQDPSGSLDPLMRIGDQVAEVVSAHSQAGHKAAKTRAIELLGRVQLPEPSSIAQAYPHQLSGGQKQRVAIACAIAPAPRILLADEPTSALDTIVQAEVLRLLGQLVHDSSMALLLVTHDIAVAASNADRIAVLQQGRLVESGSTKQIINQPKNRYTRPLVASHIALDATRRVLDMTT